MDSVREGGVRVANIPQTYITWEELSDVVFWLRSRGATQGDAKYTCIIGSTQSSNTKVDTLEWRLRTFTGNNVMKSSYVAPILAEARIVTVDGKRPNTVTLAEAWR